MNFCEYIPVLPHTEWGLGVKIWIQGTESTGQRRHRVGATLEGFLEDVGYGRVREFTRSRGEKRGEVGIGHPDKKLPKQRPGPLWTLRS